MTLNLCLSRRRSSGAGTAENSHGYSLSPWRAILFFTLLLAGCATVPPVVQEVKIPVYVPCVTNRPARPSFEFPVLPASASDGDKVVAMARDTLLHFRYEGQLEAAIAGCL